MCFLFLDTLQYLFVPGSLFLPLLIFVDFNWGCLHANLDHRDRTEEEILDWLFFARVGWVWIAKLHVLTRNSELLHPNLIQFSVGARKWFFFSTYLFCGICHENCLLPSGFKSVAAMNPQFCTRKKTVFFLTKDKTIRQLAFILSLLLNDCRFKLKATWKFQAYPFFHFTKVYLELRSS